MRIKLFYLFLYRNKFLSKLKRLKVFSLSNKYFLSFNILNYFEKEVNYLCLRFNKFYLIIIKYLMQLNFKDLDLLYYDKFKCL